MPTPARARLTSILTPLAFAVPGLVAGFLAAKFLLPDLSGAGPWWVLLPGAVLAGFLAIAVHETGHVVAGRLMGFPFLLWTVGPLSMLRSPGGVRLRFNPSLSTWGGMAACMPRGEEDLARRMTVYALGGPVASAGAAVGFLILAGTAADGAVAFLSALVGLISLFIAAAALIPHRSGGQHSDGALARLYRRGGADAAAALLRARILATSMSGVRPRDLPSGDLTRLAERSVSTPEHAADLFLLYMHALDAGDLRRAGEALEGASRRDADLSPMFRSALAAEQAFFHAVVLGDRPGAETWSARVRNEHLGYAPELVCRWNAAMALAAGEPGDALMHARAGLRATGLAMDRGGASFHSDLLEQIIRAASEGAPGGHAPDAVPVPAR